MTIERRWKEGFHWFNDSYRFIDVIICMRDLFALRTFLSI